MVILFLQVACYQTWVPVPNVELPPEEPRGISHIIQDIGIALCCNSDLDSETQLLKTARYRIQRNEARIGWKLHLWHLVLTVLQVFMKAVEGDRLSVIIYSYRPYPPHKISPWLKRCMAILEVMTVFWINLRMEIYTGDCKFRQRFVAKDVTDFM